MGKLKQYFENVKKIEEINQSFLICNTNLDNISQELKEIINKYIFEDEDLYETNVMIIKPEKNTISKEKIILLQEQFSQTSQIYNKKVYIIDECEKMNPSAYNSLLKFLEEPEKDIYAFLITSNILMVPPTIKSRCFILQISSEIEKFVDSSVNLDLIVETAHLIENQNLKAIAYAYEDIKKMDREDFFKFIKYLKFFYMDMINCEYKQNLEIYYDYQNDIEKILKINNLSMITRKILLLNDIEQKFNSNLNTSLTFDKIVIEMENIKNEYSNGKM